MVNHQEGDPRKGIDHLSINCNILTNWKSTCERYVYSTWHGPICIIASIFFTDLELNGNMDLIDSNLVFKSQWVLEILNIEIATTMEYTL